MKNFFVKPMLAAVAAIFPLSLIPVSQASIVENLAQAVQIKTISHQNPADNNYAEFRRFQQFLRTTYPQTFTQLRVDTVAEHSLVLTWTGSSHDLKPVLFDSHYDVVPVEPGTEGDWTHPPFAATLADGYLWGRGALDDKPAVIATFEAIETLLIAGFQPQRTLLFSFSHDEEIGGPIGAANIARHLKARDIKLEFMIGEGGLLLKDSPFIKDKTMAMVSLAEKSYVTLELSTKGLGGHSSNPVEDNALIRLAVAVEKLHSNPFSPELAAPVTNMLEVLGEHTDGLQGFMMRNQWLGGSFIASAMNKQKGSLALVRNTTAVTMFNAGIKENVISQQAEAKVNFRLLPGYSTEQLIESVKGIIDDPRVKIKPHAWQPNPGVADIKGIGYQRISAAITEVSPDAIIVPGLLTASSDTPYYAELSENIYRFHPYTLPMGDLGSVHGTNERISIKSVEQSVKYSTALIKAAAY